MRTRNRTSPRTGSTALSTTRSLGRIALALVLVAFAAACQQDEKPATVRVSSSAAGAQGEDPHVAHAALGFDCETCHPCGGVFLVTGTLPGGTPVTGTITRGTPTTCAVSCHSPLSQTMNVVAWDAGPMTCTSCHAQTIVAGARSSHALGGHANECLVCHDNSAHMSRTVRLTVGDGTPGNALCLSCHSGLGTEIGGRAAPVVVHFGEGGDDPHGASGAQQAYACLDCHETHASTNAFLIRSAEGVPAEAFVSRAGEGAEQLCSRCHATRHTSCATFCHNFHEGAPNRQAHAADPVAPGAPCFACHGHEGIVRGDERVNGWIATTEFFGFHDPTACKHCHPRAGGQNLPALELVPPQVSRPVVSNDGVATATVRWTTAEPATSFVDYSVEGSSGTIRTVGESVFRREHAVSVPGLDGGSSYALRLRTADRMRNVTVTELGALVIGAPATPVLVALPDRYYCSGTPAVTFRWSASTDPTGDPLVYEVQVDQSPDFPAPEVHSSSPGATSLEANLTTSTAGTKHYWRVRAREAPEGLASTWTPSDSVILYRYWWCF